MRASSLLGSREKPEASKRDRPGRGRAAGVEASNGRFRGAAAGLA